MNAQILKIGFPTCLLDQVLSTCSLFTQVDLFTTHELWGCHNHSFPSVVLWANWTSVNQNSRVLDQMPLLSLILLVVWPGNQCMVQGKLRICAQLVLATCKNWWKWFKNSMFWTPLHRMRLQNSDVHLKTKISCIWAVFNVKNTCHLLLELYI